MKKIKFLALTMSALLSANFAWGAEETLTIDYDCFSSHGTSYNSKAWSATTSDNKTINGVANVAFDNNKTYIKLRNDMPGISNSTALPGTLVSITMTKQSGSNRQMTIYGGKEQLTGDNYTSKGTSLGQKNLADTPVTLELTSDQQKAGYTYFFIKGSGSVAYLDNVVITYSAASSCEEPTVLTEDGACQTKTDYDLDNCFASDNTSTVTFTCTSGNASSCTISGSTFRATAAGTYTIKATQAADDTYCAVEETFNVVVTAPTCYVTFLNNSQPISGTGIDAQGRKQYHEGDQLGELPTLDEGDACDATSTTFMGWYNGAAITTKQSTAPTLVTPSTTVDGDMTLRAVWAKEQ